MSLEKIKEIKKQISTLRTELNAEAKETLKEFSKEFFGKYPELYIAWAQYTPYFMDGGPCVFNMHEVMCEFDIQDPAIVNALKNPESDLNKKYLAKPGEDLYDFTNLDEEDEWFSAYESFTNYSNIQSGIVKDMNDAINTVEQILDSESALQMFGDHVVVKLNKNGITVEEFNHG